MNRNILIDANNLFHRSYAIYVKDKDPSQLLTNSRGYPTGFIYGVYSMLQDWIGDISNPTRIIFFMDGVPKRRLELDSHYKEKPEPRSAPGKDEAPIKLSDGFDAKNELDIIFHLGSLLGIDTYYDKFEEADDLIASFVQQHQYDVNVIISSDKDFYQLLGQYSTLVLYRPGVSGNRICDAEKATDNMEKLYKVRIRPHEILMFKALTGDPSDGIKGVPRLRKKLLAPLCKFNDVEELMKTGLPGFSKVEKTNTIAMKDRIALNLKLIKLKEDINIDPYLQKSNSDFNSASIIFKEDLEMNTIQVSNFKTLSNRSIRVSTPVIPDWLSDI